MNNVTSETGVNHAEVCNTGLVGCARVCGPATARHATFVLRQCESYCGIRDWRYMELHCRILRAEQGRHHLG